MGPPAARSRRARLHRPARPGGTGAALLQSGLDAARGHGAGRRPRAEIVVLARGTVRASAGAVSRSRGWAPVRSRCTSPVSRSSGRRRRPTIPVARKEKEELPAEELRLQPPGARPPAAGAAAQSHPPSPSAAASPPLLDRAGVSRDRDADPHQADARGRARLPRAEPGAPGRVLRAAAESPQIYKQLLMVAGLRPLLPDRALFPGRGSAGGPAAGVHPDRHRGVVRRGGGHPERRSSASWCDALGGSRPVKSRCPFPRLRVRRGDGALRHRQARPSLRSRDSRC